jgi:sporulation protein YlmC with PRC-barrel domain
MKTIMTSVAFAALLAASPAFAGGQFQQIAQADQQPMQSQDMQAAPACPEGQTCPDDSTTGAQDQPETTGALPAQPAATDSAASEQPQDDATTQMAAEQPAGKFLQEQDDNAVLASELMGQTVYDAADNSLGDVNDIIWTEDGNIQGVVVGVGGFLGIGEKAVAVNYSALNVTTDENGNKKLVLDATADELAAAPEFVTTEQKLAEAQAAQQPAIDQGTGVVAPLQQPQAPAQ